MHVLCNLFLFLCRMENRNVRDQEEELEKQELVVVDECDEEEMTNEDAIDAQVASAGIVLIHFLL